MFDLFEMAMESGDTWYEVAAKGLDEYITCPGDHAINWRDKGYSTILDILMVRIGQWELEENL